MEPKLLNQRLLVTLCYGGALFTLGLIISQKGPSFLDLQLISGTDVQGGSFFFTASACGYLCGSLIAGAIYDRIRKKSLLMFVPMVLTAVFTILTPWCSSFTTMLIVHWTVSVFCALFETTAQAETVATWEGESAPAMQFLSFSYSFGGIVGPFITEPFLAPLRNATQIKESMTRLNNSEYNATKLFNSSDSLQYTSDSNLTLSMYEIKPVVNIHEKNSSSDVLDNNDMAKLSRINIAYGIGGISVILASVPFLVFFIKNFKKRRQRKEKKPNTSLPARKLPKRLYIGIIALLSAFYFFYTTVDDCFQQYLSIFVVIWLNWTKQKGAEVTAMYWGCSTATKLLIIILVKRVSPGRILLLSSIGLVVAVSMFTVSALFKNDVMIWVSTLCFSLTQSSMFGGGMAWVDSTLVKLDGKVTSSAMIFASFGAMTAPFLLGYTMKHLSPMSFPYLLLSESVVTFFIFLFMLAVMKPYVQKHYGPPRLSVSLTVEADKQIVSSQTENEKVISMCNGDDNLLQNA